MREATLILIFRGVGENREVLLAMKKRGFGLDKWNGPGGKVESDIGELPEDGIVRETREEVGIQVHAVDKLAEFDFLFPHKPENNFHCYLYSTENFTGEGVESEEMRPKWFKASEIPYDSMWDDDKIWLPKILEGKKLAGFFEFSDQGKVLRYKLDEV